MSMPDDLAAYLASQGHGAVGTTLTKAVMPELPDVLTTVYETPGLEPVRAMGTGGIGVCEYPRAQIVARAATPNAARDRAMDALTALDGKSFTSTGGVRYHLVEALQRPPFPLGPDATGSRYRFAFNLQLHKALST